jgi:hypothetical protein
MGEEKTKIAKFGERNRGGADASGLRPNRINECNRDLSSIITLWW